MKTLISIILLLTATQAHAYTFRYNCIIKGYNEQLRVTINEKQLTIMDVIEGNGSQKRGDLGFLNAGFKGGSGKMAKQLVFIWSKNVSTIYNWNLSHEYYVQPELLKGGVRLPNGQLGGYISFVGGGYSYESYLCLTKR